MRLCTVLLLLGSVAPTRAVAFDCPDYAVELDRLRDLEPAATNGSLTDAEKDCLEAAYAKSTVQTAKNKISRVLLVNAYAYSTSYWAKLMRRHLDEVERADPDLAYLWAYYNYNTDPVGKAAEVIQWTETGLERKDIWTGDVYVSRVYGLMRLRAVAANAVWVDAEAQHAKGQDRDDLEDLRNKAKVFAREWLDFARVSGRDPSESLKLCLSTATLAKACGVDE